MVVEDEPDLRFLLRWIFEDAGFEVTCAGHGALALACVRESPPDLVVTDMMMPVMDGTELIRRLRVDPATAAIPILVTTADIDLVHGADAVLSKPYRRADLVVLANALLGKKVDRS